MSFTAHRDFHLGRDDHSSHLEVKVEVKETLLEMKHLMKYTVHTNTQLCPQ